MEWSDRWLLRFNSDKCKILHIGDNNPKYDYVMNENGELVNLKSTDCEKDLGIYVQGDFFETERIFFLNSSKTK